MEIVFWIAVGLVAYNLALFPAAVIVLSYLIGRRERIDESYAPTVTVLITAYNEEKHIHRKLENTVALDYPKDKMEILVALDGCSDRTAEIVRAFPDPRIRVLEYPERRGKTPVQNDASLEATGEIIYFTDATGLHNPEAVKKLVARCADPTVGCVTGLVVFSAEREPGSEGVSARLGYEHYVRDRLGRLRSMLGATGANYAMRRDAVRHVGKGLTHDYAAPILALLEGKRTVFEREAVASIERPLRGKDEYKRRARITAQGLWAVFALPEALNPLKQPYTAVTIVSMRLLKWLIPVFLVVAFVANLFLLGKHPLYVVTFAAQAAVYAMAVVGAIWQGASKPPAIVNVALYFCVLNLSALKGIWDFIRRERYVKWEATSR